MKIDLHAHSTASDGTQTPAELIVDAVEAGLDMIAITDHDTTSGWDDAEQAARQHGIALVRGIEISCSRGGRSIHLLGYLPNPDDPHLTVELARARDSRVTRIDRMVEAMTADNIDITVDEVRQQMAPGATMGRPHIADALVQKGIAKDRDEAFRRWLDDQSPYYVGHYAPDPVRAVEIVRAAGGVAVLAHPFAIRSGTITDDMVEEMVGAGLAGLEAHHRDHTPEETARAITLAQHHNLVVTGSSDYHGTGKLNRLGEHATDPDQWATLAEHARGVAVIAP